MLKPDAYPCCPYLCPFHQHSFVHPYQTAVHRHDSCAPQVAQQEGQGQVGEGRRGSHAASEGSQARGIAMQPFSAFAHASSSGVQQFGEGRTGSHTPAEAQGSAMQPSPAFTLDHINGVLQTQSGVGRRGSHAMLTQPLPLPGQESGNNSNVRQGTALTTSGRKRAAASAFGEAAASKAARQGSFNSPSAAGSSHNSGGEAATAVAGGGLGLTDGKMAMADGEITGRRRVYTLRQRRGKRLTQEAWFQDEDGEEMYDC